MALPCFHVGYFKAVISILQNICKDCSTVLLDETTKRKFLAELRRPGIDNLRRMQILKKINEQCKKQRNCLKCGAINGVVKKVGALRMIHDKFRWVSKKEPEEKIEFENSFNEVKKVSPEVEKYAKRAMDDLNPLKVFHLFERISPSDYVFLGMDSTKGRPEMYLWQYIPAPPVCIRPSVQQDGASNEDDLTTQLSEIAFTNSIIRAGLDAGMVVGNLMRHWDYLQYSIALYINGDMPSWPGMQIKSVRGLCQRLKGKQGRFRGNLSGKRVDFSGRTVISPDPNLNIGQVAVPDRVARILTYPEKVTVYNMEKMQRLVANGALNYPGANYVIKKNEEMKRSLRYGKLNEIAANLSIGDVVERHLEDDDVVLFNRQPSLHRLSILAHKAKIRPWRTFRLNECTCTPFGADFDGDEMNLHVPQTEEARAEALNLMGVKYNLVTPKSGEPIIAATQDFITASYLITRKDSFFDRATFTEMCVMMSDGIIQFDIPPPAIVKPVKLWTGKQLYSLLIRPNKKSNVIVNLDAKNKTFVAPPKGQPQEMSPNDGFLVIRGSQVLAGVMDKSTLGDGKKAQVFYTILRDYGPDEAVGAMNRMAKLCARYLGNRGFSIGINDVTPGKNLNSEKDKLIEIAYQRCDDLIELLKEGKLETQPGCNEEQTLEAKIGGILSKVREEVGEVCINELEKNNAPLIMASCGSKGSTVNVSQMVAAVGQQIIAGNRVPNGFQDRTLPHFPKFSKTPPSKGFVRNSFFSGLNPPEFLFHAISGREGLVDTAVKTAETGYMSRRLMKSLEDLSCKYDSTVRTSSNSIVQFQYGGDGLDPFEMEGDAKPVNFVRTWMHCIDITFSHDEPGLFPYQIVDLATSIVTPLKSRLARRDNLGNIISGTKKERLDIYTDEYDPLRGFYDSVLDFIKSKAGELANVRKRKNMQPLLTAPYGDYADIDFDELVTPAKRIVVNQLYKISESAIREFLSQCLKKFERSKVEPGTAVGAIGAQSIGEPGTQMTLKTFHFAGVASMNVTLGVPRIKEIINASKVISTPIITAYLVNDHDERAARVVKGRIEKTFLSDVVKYIDDVYEAHRAYIRVKIDWNTIEMLQLELTIDDICKAIAKAPKLKLSISDVAATGNDIITVQVRDTATTTSAAKAKALSWTVSSSATMVGNDSEIFYKAQILRRSLPHVAVKGFPDISRAVINIREKDNKTELLVEGYGLKHVMTVDGVVGHRTVTNHVLEMYSVLGIEAARTSIVDEINYTMGSHGMSVDPRHIQLLGDMMTFKGEVLGITRFGLSKMRDSVLQLASFEKTTDHLFDASFYMKTDKIEGVSECIILGQSMSLGTGSFNLVYPTQITTNDEPFIGKRLVLGKKEPFFETLWVKEAMEAPEFDEDNDVVFADGTAIDIDSDVNIVDE